MKASTKILSLMVALAAGSAFAVPAVPTGTSAGTTAGTAIDNQAFATYDDPTTGTPITDIPSNTVTTYVSAVTGFDIMYSSNDADGTTATGTLTTSYDKNGVLPGDKVTTAYTVVNNGNIGSYRVNLTANTTGSTTPLPAANVQYFADTNNDGVADNTTPITFVTLTNGGSQGIVQVITIPSGAVTDDKYSASPEGSAPAGTASNGVTYTQYDESQNGNNGDLQYTRATIYSPAGKVGPSGAPEATGTADTQTVAANSGVTTTTFTNTLKNTGNQADSFVLSSTPPTGTTVVFRTPSGATIDGTAKVEGGITYVTENGVPVVKNVPAMGTANFQTVVTYPATPGQISVVVSIESTSDADTTVEDSTTNVVNVPGVLFGDKTSAGPDRAQNPNPSAAPSGTASTLMAVKNTGGGSETYTFTATTVTFQVVGDSGALTPVTQPVNYVLDANCDNVADTGATPSTTLSITVAPGTVGCAIAQIAVPSKAVKQTTTAFPQTVTGTSGITDSDNNDTVSVTVSRVPQPTPPPTGYTPSVLLAKFTAKSGYAANTDTAASGQQNPAGYTTGSTTAAPKTDISYRIIAKNIYNADVTKFFLKDTVPTNTTLKSIALFTNNGTRAAVLPADTIYSTNGTTWTALSTAPTTLTAGTVYRVALDMDHNGTPDALGPNQTLELDFVVTVE